MRKGMKEKALFVVVVAVISHKDLRSSGSQLALRRGVACRLAARPTKQHVSPGDVPLVDSPRRSQTTPSAEEAVPSNLDARVRSRGRLHAGTACRAARRGQRTRQIAPDHCLGHDDRLSTEHDVLCRHEDRLAGNLVARVLYVEK